ncbi:MAG TPA: MFS transporter [Anaerolineales bacterium]|nr:MFS transporter [Anaerolineales bacterium]
MVNQTSSQGLRAFLVIWIGQLVSLVGSQLTAFALGVWVYDQTRSVLLLAITQIAFSMPQVFLSPLAGVLADRWDRRTVMILSDFGAGLAVLSAALLYLTDHLQPWMVIPLNIWMASFTVLMWPAYTASVTLLVPKEQYGRANGFVQLGEALTQVAGPALAGVLYVSIRLGNMALIDFVTYLFSVLLLVLFVRIPRPLQTEDGRRAAGSVWQEIRFGWEYITARKGLFSLLLYFLALNFLTGVMGPLFTPMILDNWQPNVLGYLSTIMGVGMLVGTLVMSAWGGGNRKVYTLLGSGLIGSIFLSAVGFRLSIPLLAVCGFGFMFTLPLMNASSQAIWQAKVAPDVQGRVFAVRRTIAWSSQIVAPLLAAPLADYVFKPAMSEGGGLAPLLGLIVGVGANHGIGVLISFLGLLSMIVCIVALLNRSIRNVEIDLPDHVTTPVGDVVTGLSNQAAD